jgi:hypothetical protein
VTLSERIAHDRKCRGCGLNPPASPSQAFCEDCLREVNRAYRPASAVMSPFVRRALDRQLPGKVTA